MDKVRCTTLLTCAKASVEEETNLLSLHSITPGITLYLNKEEQQALGGLPKSTNLPIDMVTCWEREKGVEGVIKFKYEIHLIDPNGDTIFNDAIGSVSLAVDRDIYYSVVHFSTGVPCSIPGVHTLKVVCTNDLITDTPEMYSRPFPITALDETGQVFTADPRVSQEK